MTTGPIATPRYSSEDFETVSVHSAAPSYLSEAPSYHSTAHHAEEIPAYSPSAAPSASSTSNRPSTPRQQPYGLPPIPSLPPVGIPNLHSFRIPTWSTHNAPAARQIQSVIERRASASKDAADSLKRHTWADRLPERQDNGGRPEIRPLEDPYLVGEVAAAKARRERLGREAGDDILLQEDKHWDWLIAQMKDWDERDRSWAKFRREVEAGHPKKLMRRLQGRLV